MADTNRGSLAIVEEVAWGVNPATALTELNFTGESLAFAIDNITSNSIRSDRQVTDLIQTGAQAAGDINFELQYADALSNLLQGALWDDEWHGVGSPDQATYTTTAGLTVDLVSLAGTWTFDAAFVALGTLNPAPGQTFTVSGSGAGNDGTYTILSVATGATIVITTAAAVGNETFDDAPVGVFQFNIQETITSAVGGGTLDIVTASAGNTITLGSLLVHDIVRGQWIELTCSTPTADDGRHYVTLVAGNVITVESLTVDATYTTAPTLTIAGARIRNGTTENSYWLEKAHTDIDEYFSFEGMVINTLNLSFTANSIATGSVGFMGKTANLAQATTGTGPNTAAATTNYMNAVANVGNIRINGVAAATCLIQEITISLNNNVRGLSSIGVLGFCDMGVGEINLTGNLNLYFADDTYFDMYRAGTAFSLSWEVVDSAGNVYVFDLPECKFSSDTITIGGKNADVIEQTSYQAIRDATLDTTLQITRIAA